MMKTPVILFLLLIIITFLPFKALGEALSPSEELKISGENSDNNPFGSDSAQKQSGSREFFDETDWVNQPDSGRDREFDKKMSRRIGMTCFSLVVISILIFVVLRFLSSNKINIPSLGLGQKSRLIRILDRQPLQPNKVLYLVNVADKNILIGVCENNLSALSELSSESIEKARQKNDMMDPPSPPSLFSPFEFISLDKKSEPQTPADKV